MKQWPQVGQTAWVFDEYSRLFEAVITEVSPDDQVKVSHKYIPSLQKDSWFIPHENQFKAMESIEIYDKDGKRIKNTLIRMMVEMRDRAMEEHLYLSDWDREDFAELNHMIPDAFQKIADVVKPLNIPPDHFFKYQSCIDRENRQRT